MDLGIVGRKAIVCASSRGLGRGCALALAQAGCEVVINGRDKARLEATAAEIRAAARGKVTAVGADVATAEGQAALFEACPEPDILVNNNAGPPFRDFRELDRQNMLDGVIANMVVAIELIQKAIEPMARRRFGRIVNITSGSVKMPIPGHHQFPAAGDVRDRSARIEHPVDGAASGRPRRAGARRARRGRSREALR